MLQSPGYRAIGGENLSPWSKRVTAKVERLLRYEGEQILPGDATAPANAGGLLLVGMTPAPEVETAFNAWYDKEHVPALAGVPGVLCARRFRTSGGGPKYVALYHLTSPGVVDTAGMEGRQRLDPDAPAVFATRSATGCASCAATTCAHRLARGRMDGRSRM